MVLRKRQGALGFHTEARLRGHPPSIMDTPTTDKRLKERWVTLTLAFGLFVSAPRPVTPSIDSYHKLVRAEQRREVLLQAFASTPSECSWDQDTPPLIWTGDKRDRFPISAQVLES